MKKRNNKFYIILLIKSILMGTVNKLPGVSGGLVALITGFYIEMINSLKKINFKIIPLLFKLNFSKIDKNYNGLFLLIILSGIVISYFTTSKILDLLFNSYEIFVWSVFFGMVLASNFILIQNLKTWNYNTFISIISGLNVVASGFQVALMCPTEILATQHLNLMKSITQELNIKIEILSSGVNKKRQIEIKKEIVINSLKIDCLIFAW